MLAAQAAMRVLYAKPTSTAVERLWSHIRDVFAVKRESMMPNPLHKLVYVKMIMRMLNHDELPGHLCFDLSSAPVTHKWVSSIVEAAEEHELELAVGRQAAEACVTENVSSGSVKRMCRILWTKALNLTSSTCSGIRHFSALCCFSTAHKSFQSTRALKSDTMIREDEKQPQET
jgi:hypothetical protein